MKFALIRHLSVARPMIRAHDSNLNTMCISQDIVELIVDQLSLSMHE